MTYREALERLFLLRRFGVRPSLDGVTRALEALGNPHTSFGVVHVAGTNGKGSTAAFCASLLGAANCRTGLYTSPHLCRFTERIRVDDHEIAPADVARWVERLLPLELTFFELATAMAFAAFREAGVEVAVVEAGLGGRWDATNVVTPMVSVVTGVALDHVDILGGTLESIAREKAGIFKRGVPAVAACHDPGARAVLVEEAARVGAPLALLGRDFAAYPGPLSMLGVYQTQNAGLALRAIAACPARFLASPDAQARALARTSWPGRLEWLAPDILADGAHNPDGAAALAAALPALAGRFTLIAGFVDDKDARGILAPLLPLAGRVILTRPPSPRALDPQALAAELGVEAAPSLAEALARSSGARVLCGSLFLVGEARHLILGEEMDPVSAQDPAARKL
jgi:dihydrofolate synthase/folylpolyglutamate synthase